MDEQIQQAEAQLTDGGGLEFATARYDNPGAVASKFAWREHPLGKFAKITLWLAATAKADDAILVAKPQWSGLGVTQGYLWTEVVERRCPWLPAMWATATGRRLTPTTLYNRCVYFYREHAAGGGRLIHTISGEHPLRSRRLRPYVPRVRACLLAIEGPIPQVVAQQVCDVEAAMDDSLRAYLRDQYTPGAIEIYLRTLCAMRKRRDEEKGRRMLAG